jgi:acyl carrier protein
MKTSELVPADQLIKWVRHAANGRGSVGGDDIKPDTDLLARGILDSQGFIDLLMFIESTYGCNIELLDVDPAQFSTINGLCELATQQNSQNGQLGEV